MGEKETTCIDDVIDIEYADDTAMLAECLEWVMKLTELLAEDQSEMRPEAECQENQNHASHQETRPTTASPD